MITVSREYEFSAAHSLPMVPEGHKCRGVHGHNYRVVVTFIGRGMHGGLDDRGFVADFAEIDAKLDPLLSLLDHKNLNDVIYNPTAEMIAVWIASGCGADVVRVYETPTCWAEFVKGGGE